ncbi:hypothetical protein MNBD_GAMMA08-827 [hydrothermal vent metagenome]|uniref:N-acetylmuramoyl-L-alanine amidase domain-containing protein n=1 Tax=hydrothermal vent metagenome TaxID=652676 RepID=A0A3B0WSE3_9ZZZZ
MKNSTTDLAIIDFLTPFMDKQLKKGLDSAPDYEQQVESPFLDEKIIMESWGDEQKEQEMGFAFESLSDEALNEFEEEDSEEEHLEEEHGYDIEAVAWYDETGHELQADEPHYNFTEIEELVDMSDESEDEFYDYDESLLEPDTIRALSDVKEDPLSSASLEPGGGLYGSDQYSTDMEEEQFIGSIWPFFSGFNIVDRTAYSPESKRKKVRDIDDVYALVLHQTGFSRGNIIGKYNRVTAHFVILPDGRILQLHPLTAYLWASNGFNKGSVAVEFVGNFPSDRGKCYKPEKFGCHKVTDEQVQTGQKLIKYLVKKIGLTHVLAHRQSSGSRGNDPGPEIWSRVGQWGVDEHGLNDGGAGFKTKSGRAIPESWRNKSQQELIPDFEQQIENSFLEGELLSESQINEDEPGLEATWEYLSDEAPDELYDGEDGEEYDGPDMDMDMEYSDYDNIAYGFQHEENTGYSQEYEGEWNEEDVDSEVEAAWDFEEEISILDSLRINISLVAANARGITDKNELTNIAFFSINPERNGRAIDKSDTDYDILVQQWIDIRKIYVLPFLESAKRLRRLSKVRGPLSDVSVQMPASIGDQYRFNKNAYRIFGVEEAISALRWVFDEWHKMYPEVRIGVGDISQKGGGIIKPHKSHRVGLDADLSLNIRETNERIRNNSRYKSKDYARYAKAFLDLLEKNTILKVKTIWFFDHKLSKLIPDNARSAKHKEHFHIRFEVPSRVNSSLKFNKVYDKDANKIRGYYKSIIKKQELNTVGEFYGSDESSYSMNGSEFISKHFFEENDRNDDTDAMMLALENDISGEISWSNELEKELLNEDMVIVKAASPVSSAKTITLSPKTGHLYRIKKGDNLLKIAGTAYKKKAGSMRLERAQLINRHPFNWRYYTATKKNFTRKYFPEGVISFSPYFSCFDADFNFPSKFPRKGSCYSLLFIPPETDIWQRRPDEEIQPDLRTCWAAAILSWSKVVPGARKFKSVDDVVVTFRKHKLKMLMEDGVVAKRDIVTSSGRLVRWPKKKVNFIEGKSTVVIQAGQRTLEKVAAELGLNLVIKDSSLSISDVQEIFRRSNGPVVVLKFNKGIGHGTVIFGVSESDKMIGEMDPFPAKRPTGPAYGSMMTRWLPTFESFKKDSHGKPWSDFSFLF